MEAPMEQISKEARTILNILKKEQIHFQLEYTFPDLKGKKGVPYRFDFAIFKNGHLYCLVEYDSTLHFDKNNKLVKNPKRYRENDVKKNVYCLAHDIPLYRISYWDLKNIHTFSDIVNEKYLVKSKWHNYQVAEKHGML